MAFLLDVVDEWLKRKVNKPVGAYLVTLQLPFLVLVLLLIIMFHYYYYSSKIQNSRFSEISAKAEITGLILV